MNSDQKKTEEMILESQALLAGIIESAMDAIITIDSHQKILVFNRAAEKMFRCTAAEAIGQSLGRFIPQRFRDSHSNFVQSFGSTDVPNRSMGGIIDVYGLRDNGEEFPVEASISQIEANDQKLFTVIMRDISERIRAQEGYIKLASIVESSSDAIYSSDFKGKILSWNKGAENIFGYTAEEAIGQSIGLIFPVDFLDEEHDIVTKIRLGEEIKNYETVRRRKDGSNIEVSLTASPFYNKAGDVIGISKIVRDITEHKQAERKAHESSQNFQALVEATAQAVWEANENGGSSGIAHWWEQLTGQKLTDLKPWQWVEALHPDDREKAQSAWTAALANKTQFDVEYRIKNKKGKYEDFIVRGVPIFNENGTFRQWIGTFTNITERKLAEKALRESEERLRLFVEYAPAAVAMFDCEMKYLVFSQRWLHDFRLTSDVIGRSHYDVFPDIPERWKEIHRQCLAGAVLKSDEEEFTQLDGSTGWMKWEVRPWYDGAGGIGGITIFSEDITSQKESENQLQKSEERYRLLFDSNPHPMWVYDIETLVFLEVNDAAVYKYGYSHDEFLSMTIKDIRSSEDVTKLLDNIKDLAKYQTSEIWKHRKKDGTYFDVEITAHDFVLNHRMARLVLAQDVTEKRSLEEQLRQSQKMEAVGQLAGGVAHDFNNMLTAINGYSNLILRQLRHDDPLRGRVEEINKAGERAAVLTRQLLAFSRKQLLQPKILDLNKIISEIEKMLRRLIGENIVFRTVLEHSLGSVKADPGQIEQTILNLAVNARDAMPAGGKLVIETQNVYLDETYVSQHIAVNPGHYVMLAVSDSGMGIPPETQARIFEPFFTTKELGKGTGLGLSTVYGIVKQSGGSIWVYSEVDKGTTFKVYLPRVDEVPQEYTKPNLEASFQGTETVLLVEDEDIVRHLTREVLETYGYKVLEAANHHSATFICENYPRTIQLLISDVIMPEMNGPELVRELLQIHPEMKVLFMSGYTDNAIVSQGLFDERVNFIEKPFTPERLSRKVRQILDENEKKV